MLAVIATDYLCYNLTFWEHNRLALRLQTWDFPSEPSGRETSHTKHPKTRVSDPVQSEDRCRPAGLPSTVCLTEATL